MIEIAPQCSWPPVEGELAVYDARDGRYHVLNESAAEIWRGIAAGKPAETIAAELAEASHAPVETVRRDVDAFIAEGIAMGLLLSPPR